MKKISSRAYILHKTLDYLGVAFLAMLLLFLWQLYRGPIAIPFLKPYIITALNHDDSEYQVTLDSVNLELVRSIKPVKIIANNVTYRKKDGSFIINAPKTSVSFSIRALLHGVVAPSNIEVIKPSVYIFTDYGVEKDKPNEANKKKLEYYFDLFDDYIERFNSEDNSYSEGYINGIEIKNAEVEFHEVDLGRKWALSDLNYHFSRNFSSMESDFNALVKIKDKIASVGLEAEYRNLSEKLALRFYFSDVVPASASNDLPAGGFFEELAKVNLPLSGKIDAMVNFKAVLQNREDISKNLETAIEKLSFEFEGGSGSIDFSPENNHKYNVAAFLLGGEITSGLDKISIKNANFDLDGQKTLLSFNLEGLTEYFLNENPENISFSVRADIPKLKFDRLYDLWPRYIAEDAWLWCKDSLYGGEADNASFVFDFAYDKQNKTIAFKDLKGSADIRDANLNYLRGMPDITNIYGKFGVTSSTLTVDIDKGVSEGVIMTGGSVLLYDLDKYDNFADIHIIAESSIANALKLIDNPPLGYASEMGLNPDSIQGTAETDLGLKFELKNNLGTDEVHVVVKSDLKDVVIPDVVQGKSVKAKELKMDVTNQGMLITGDITLDDFPLKLVWDEKFADKNYNSRYKLSFNYNEAFKKKFGLNSEMLNPPYIDGSAAIEADITTYPADKMTVDLKAALVNTKLDFSFLGLKKQRGERAQLQARIDINKGAVTAVPSFIFNKRDFNLTGRAVLDNKGQVKLIDISNITAPKTSAKARIELANTAKQKIKINVSGNSYDLSPFFESDDDVVKRVKPRDGKRISRPRKNEWENVDDTDINIAVNNLWTTQNLAIRNFAGSAKLRNGIGIAEMHIIGNFSAVSRSFLKLNYVPHVKGEYLLEVESNNAGDTLRALHIYENMRGGTLNINARRDKYKDIIGHAKIRNYSLHNTPVLAKLLSIASLSGMVNMLTGEGLKFSHFDAPFTYSDQVLTVKEAKAFGNVVGITANGSYDRYYDDINVKGVVAPAYSLNTMIGKIPVVGNLLSGKDGTVFAANYQVTGDMEDPKISINPLSALSPSSLKDILSSIFGDSNARK